MFVGEERLFDSDVLLGDPYKGPGLMFGKNLGVPRRWGDSSKAFDVVL
jgi:hypothetical protein